MGRLVPSHATLPNHTRRAERASRAKDTINKAIPELLRSSPRARHGIHKAERIVDPAPFNDTIPSSTTPFTPGTTHLKIRLTCSDTLSAASRLAEHPFSIKKSAVSHKAQQQADVAILNFASPLRPGGGFLDGANSQEEFLCARTTLYPSLWEAFYRLPEVGGSYTPDVLVFRDSTPEANDISKRDRYFVNVISAGMIRFPDARGRTDERPSRNGCSCGVSYCDQDRELVTNKMKAVMRIAESKGNKKVILGAWGCGAYGNPVSEVAKIWRKVIVGSRRQRKPNAETWSGIEEIIFAIPDREMMSEFEKAFGDVLATDPIITPEEPAEGGEEEEREIDDAQQQQQQRQNDDDAITNDLISKIAALESQLDNATNSRAKARIREVLAGLNKELTRGLANKAAQDEDLTLQEDEEADGFVLSGYPSSEMDNRFNFDENDVASDESCSSSSEGEHSEIYEFRRATRKGSDDSRRLSQSPKFDPSTGWFSGSMDELQRMLKLSSSDAGLPSRSSHGTPGVGDAAEDIAPDFDEVAIHAYLTRYGGTDAVSEGPSVR